MEVSQILARIHELDTRNKVQFIVLFGSHASGEAHSLSDLDFAVYYDAPKEERFRFRLHLLGHLPDVVDVKIFQDLPTLVQNEVIQGKVLYSRDKSFTTAQFVNTIREYRSFSRAFTTYVDAAKGDVIGT
jgi:predicted nucleotidyltransferase